VASCEPCSRAKTKRHKEYGLLKSLPIPSRPFESINMDRITHLPLSSGHDAILVIVDRFTKFALFIPVWDDINGEEMRATSLPAASGALRYSVWARSLALRLRTTHVPTEAQNESTRRSRRTYACSARTRKTTGRNICRSLSIHTTARGIRPPVSHRFAR